MKGVIKNTTNGWVIEIDPERQLSLHPNSTDGWSIVERVWFFREMDNQEIEGEIIDNMFKPFKPIMDWQYWKNRCLAAEKYIELTPCDSDIYEDQNMAYYNWITLVKNER
jgi:hypothetical protein